jgi:glycosyltransferase involved in cell wall biosynthesis
MISAIVTIYNKQELVRKVLEGIYNNSSDEMDELIIVLDGCTDESEQKVKQFIFEYGERWLDKGIQVIKTPNLYETRANNVGLKAVNPKNEFGIIVQDDCVVTESYFDTFLVEPMIRWPDIWAVSGRNSYDPRYVPDSPYVFHEENMTGADTNKNERGIFYVRKCINRGPLCVRMSTMKQMNYFSEDIWLQNNDDTLLSLDVYKELGMKCGSTHVDYESRPEWGSTRQPGAQWIMKAIWINGNMVYTKHRELIDGPNWDEERNMRL